MTLIEIDSKKMNSYSLYLINYYIKNCKKVLFIRYYTEL